MKLQNFDISRGRFHPLWLIVGLLIGRAIGLITGLDLGFWYFAHTASLIAWQVAGAIFFALLVSFMMTSDLVRQVKYALLGFGIGCAVCLYVGEIWSIRSGSISSITAGEGIFFDWLLIHSAAVGAIVGFIIGHVMWKRSRKRGQ